MAAWTFEMTVEEGKLRELARALRATDGPYSPDGGGDRVELRVDVGDDPVLTGWAALDLGAPPRAAD